MDDSSLIERVAEAIWRDYRRLLVRRGLMAEVAALVWDDVHKELKAQYRGHARAALAVVRSDDGAGGGG